VYEIKSEAIPRRYIGMSQEPQVRWRAHLYASVSRDEPLYEAMRNIGPQHFVFSVIADYEHRIDAAAHESGLIRFLMESGQNPFNQTFGGSGVLRPYNEDDPMLVEICHRINTGGGLMAWCQQNGADATAVSRYVNGHRAAPGRIYEILGHPKPTIQQRAVIAAQLASRKAAMEDSK